MANSSDDFQKPHDLTIPQGNPDDVDSDEETSLESDDDVLKSAQDAGLYEDANDENPIPVDIVSEMKKDEEKNIPPEKQEGDANYNN